MRLKGVLRSFFKIIKTLSYFIFEHVSEQWPFYLIIFVAFILSCGGVIYALRTQIPSDGGRGGALADIVSLLALFVSRINADRTYRDIAHMATENENKIRELFAYSPKILEPDVSHTARAAAGKRALIEKGQKVQNICLAIATTIGTLFWGFGDLIAVEFLPQPGPLVIGGAFAPIAVKPPIGSTKFQCMNSAVSAIAAFPVGSIELTPGELESGIGSVREWVNLNADDNTRLIGMVVIGAADKRSLSVHLRQQYGDNSGLAMGRAEKIAAELEKALGLSHSSMMTIYAGPSVLGNSQTEQGMASDRTVRICGLWG